LPGTPLRILYLVAAPGIPVSGPSGASAHVRGITAGLAGLGHRVDLVATRDLDARGALEAPSVPLHCAGVAPPPAHRLLPRHRDELRTARRIAALALRVAASDPQPVDLVVERHALFSDAGLRTARQLRVPCVLEVNAPQRRERDAFEQPVSRWFAPRWERRVLRGADHCVAVSRWLCRWLVEEIGCRPQGVQHLPNGVAGLVGDRARGRALAGLADDSFVLGFVGSFRPWHGLDLLPPLLDLLPEATLLAVGQARPGEAPHYASLLEHPRVRAVGKRTAAELAHLVAAMDVGLAPYPADAPPWFSPLKLLDYRAQGTPTVASDLADCATLMDGAGSLVPPGDLRAAAAAIRSWRGRRCAPSPRPWTQVATELLRGVHPLLPLGNTEKRG